MKAVLQPSQAVRQALIGDSQRFVDANQRTCWLSNAACAGSVVVLERLEEALVGGVPSLERFFDDLVTVLAEPASTL